MRGVVPLLSLLLILPAAAQIPEQIHVGLGATVGDASMGPPEVSHFVVSWATLTPYGPQHQPRVRFQIDGGEEQVVPAALIGVARDTGPVSEADTIPQYGARIAVPRGSLLAYDVGEPSLGLSDVREVRMVPFENQPLRVAVTAWIGEDGYDRATRQRIATAEAPQEDIINLTIQQEPDLLLIAGNLGASTSAHPWDIAMRSLDPLVSRVPIMVAAGINDAADDYNQLRSRFEFPLVDRGTVNTVLPIPASPANAVLGADDAEQFYYGFSAGPAYFVVLNTASLCEALPGPATSTPPCMPGTGAPNYEQDLWLHDVLEDAREDLQPKWLIVLMSQGPYIHADDGANPMIAQRLGPYFDQYGVDLVLYGGEQLYQRSHSVWNGQVTAKGDKLPASAGTVYVNTALGQIERLPGSPPWLAASYSDYHLTLLDIGQDELSIRALAKDGALVDQVVIQKSLTMTPADETEQEAPAPWLAILPALALAALARRRTR